MSKGHPRAGKTTWLSRFDNAVVVAELGRIEPPHEPGDDESQFWTDRNAERWHCALSVEAGHGCPLCDTDPLKLHYDYCRARAGIVAWSVFEAGVAATGAAIPARRIGIADLILCEIPDAETLDARQRGDTTLARHRFDLHRRFGPALRDWYGTLEALDPGRVVWTFPDSVPEAERRDRYSVDLFERWMSDLPDRTIAIR